MENKNCPKHTETTSLRPYKLFFSSVVKGNYDQVVAIHKDNDGFPLSMRFRWLHPIEQTTALYQAITLGCRSEMIDLFLESLADSSDAYLTPEEIDGIKFILENCIGPQYVLEPLREILHKNGIIYCGPVPVPNPLDGNPVDHSDLPNVPPQETDPKVELTLEKSCIVCNTTVKNAVNVPCGHMSCCVNCTREYILTHKKTDCMICKQPIEKVVKLYS